MDDADDIARARHRAAVSAYLQSCLAGPSNIVNYHADAARSTASSAAPLSRQSMCPACGSLCIPGLAGHIRLERSKPGKRARKPNERGRRPNKLLWACRCGSTSRKGGSDAPSLRRFKTRKARDVMNLTPNDALWHCRQRSESHGLALEPPADSLQSHAAAGKPADAAAETTASKAPTSTTIGGVRPSPVDRVETAETTQSLPGGSMLAKAGPQASLKTQTVVSLTPVQREKRVKKESLQAMLARKKQDDTQRKGTAPNNNLGLSSFLQSL